MSERGLRGRLGENLQKRVNFNSFKDTINRIGVLFDEAFNLLSRLKLQHQQAPGFIRKRACQDDSPLPIQRFEVREVGGPMSFPSGLALWAVVANNDELHTQTLSALRCGCPIPVEECLGRLFLDRATIIVSGGEFVPPADFFLAEFPT